MLPLALLTRMVRTNDTLMVLVPLLEDPPWVRRRNKKTEKFIGNVWTAVETRDRLRLTQHDAQVRSKLACVNGVEVCIDMLLCPNAILEGYAECSAAGCCSACASNIM